MSDASVPGELPPVSVLPRWDAVVIRWALAPGERSALLAAVPDGPIADVATYRVDEAERRIRLVVRLASALDRAFDDEERIRSWLRAQNTGLGGLSPIEAMAASTEWTLRLISIVETFS